MNITCFKAYDARGRVPDEINEEIAYRIGRAYAEFVKPETVVLGYDVRSTSLDLQNAMARGLMDAGVNVFDIGECGTEEVYFATFHYKMDGGIMTTASHNPMDYNGFKFVREEAIPISGDSGLEEIQKIAEKGEFVTATKTGKTSQLEHRADYIKHMLGYVDIAQLKPLKIVVNAGNGGAGPVLDLLAAHLPFEFIRINHEPDGSFPNGIPNPLLPERRADTIKAMQEHQADLGIAWDGDFDRCFFFDENARFIEGYYIVGLFAAHLLRKKPDSTIVYDPRLIWNSIDVINEHHGHPIQSKAGHAFIKETMRKEDALYGGEMSAHHFFRDFGYCDSGMIPWLIMAEILSNSEQPLSTLLDERINAYPVSGEINRRVDDADAVIEAVKQYYMGAKPSIDTTDGMGMSFNDWRFNIRASNTEPVLRLNVESKANNALLQEKTEELLKLMQGTPT